MIKKLLSTVLLFTSIGVMKSSAQALCTSNISCVHPDSTFGICPDSATGLPAGTISQAYSVTLSIKIPATTISGGQTYSLTHYALTDVLVDTSTSGTSAYVALSTIGLTYLASGTNTPSGGATGIGGYTMTKYGYWAAPGSGCAIVSGTPNKTGTFKIRIVSQARAIFFGTGAWANAPNNDDYQLIVTAQPSSGQCDELFISEYVEGTGNDKAIEIYNPTNSAINLSAYSIKRYLNGSSTTTENLQLSGTIAAHDVFVIVNGQTTIQGGGTSPAVSLALQAMADQLDAPYPAPLFFNGDDAITLEKSGVLVDIFGKIGEDPGTAWSTVFPFNGAGTWITKDYTLQRKATVNGGVTVNPTVFEALVEYDSLAKDTWTGLGAHTCNCIQGTLAFQMSGTHVTCTSLGSITVNVSGATGTIHYSNDGGNTYQLSNIFNGLAAGTYQIVVKDANNVPTTAQSYIVTQSSSIVTTFSNTSVACYGENTGSASVTASSGVSPYSYNWLPYGGVSATASGLTAGTYTVTVVDYSGCSASATVTITQPTGALNIYNTSIVNTQCGVSDGQITANVLGGTTPIQYAWSNGDITNLSQNLSAGDYSLIVTDGNGCTVTTAVLSVVTDPPNYNIAFTAIATTGAAPFFAGFTNSTPGISNYNFTWFWGDGTFTASNSTNVTHTYPYGGFYDVTLVATNIANGCADTLKKTGYIFITGTGCTHTATVSPSAPFSGCTGDALVLTASTNASTGYTYQWNMNGTVISGATSNALTITQTGYYSVTVIQSGCPVTSAAVQVSMNTNPPQPLITATGTIVACMGGSVTLTASLLSGANYLWSTSATTQSITVSTQGVYSVTASYGSSVCSSTSAPFYLGTSLPVVPLCLVTVDSLSTHNVVVWEKTGLSPAIDSFRIYRETMTNVYSNIASISYDSLSVFHDYAANPNVTSYKYKLAAIDTCGSISALSDFHNTIHLQYLGNGNLQWTLYDIEGAGNPVNFYIVNRDDTNTGTFLPISSTIPGGNSTYTDVNYGTYPNARYRVDATWSISCTPTRAITTTRSNILHPSPSSISQLESVNTISIFPNPASTKLYIKGLSKNEKIITLTNVLGEKVKTIETNGNTMLEINVESLINGIYFIKIYNRSFKFIKS